MSWLAAAFGAWIAGASVAGMWPGRRGPGSLVVATTVAGAVCLIGAALQALSGDAQVSEALVALPFGPWALRLDPIAAVFLVPIAIVGALAAVYAPAYARLGDHGEERVGQLIALELLLASMVLVVVAANMVLFLAAWEVMTITSWVVLSRDHDEREVRHAGLNYLIAGHVSGGALAILFVLLAETGSGWRLPASPAIATAGSGVLFLLALVGFGIKAAVAPFHVWLPDAHGAAPSHVSALMSGVLITLGIYGLVRFLPLLGPTVAWAMTLMALGALGACGGIVMALSQRDVKRVLAYSTIENTGLMVLAIGAALLAAASGMSLVAALAWSAALLHVWNHAVAKSLLFLSAGAIAQRARSRDLERWGGLLRRLPLLGGALFVGAAAIVGLPGTHGFASEWLLLLSLFLGGQSFAGPGRLAMLLAIAAVTFTAGAAVACFVRLVGIGLLGHPRSPEAAAATRPVSPGLEIPVWLLAAACFVLVSLLEPMLSLIGRAVVQLVPGAPIDQVLGLAVPLPWLAGLPLVAGAAVVIYRAWLWRTRTIRAEVTWDCGYSRPEPSMQYTASSLPQPITSVLQPALATTVSWRPPAGLWPGAMAWESQTPERALSEVYAPAFFRLARLLGFFRRLQEGRVMVYLRYIGMALLLLIVWFFWPSGVAR